MQLTLGHHKCLIFVAMSHCELQVEYVCYETVAYVFIKCLMNSFTSYNWDRKLGVAAKFVFASLRASG